MELKYQRYMSTCTGEQKHKFAMAEDNKSHNDDVTRDHMYMYMYMYFTFSDQVIVHD